MYCTECLWTWPSSRLKRHHFGYPVPDKIVKMDTLFQTEKCDTHLTFESEKACVSKYVAGPEWELATTFIYSATLAVTPTVFSSRNNKNFTLFQTEKLIGRPFFPDSERQKPYKLYSSYMRVHRSPPPPPPLLCHLDLFFRFLCFLLWSGNTRTCSNYSVPQSAPKVKMSLKIILLTSLLNSR